jgi:acyl-coenzyme A thioesterase PaaI-like protein
LSSDPHSLPAAYPPDEHFLRDLRLWIERGPEGSRAGLEVVPEMCAEPGGVRAGVLATLVDAAGAEAAVRAARPHWVATSDLVLHLLAPARAGVVLGVPALLRRTRSTLVLEVALRAGASGAALGLATLSFAVLTARGEVQRMGAGAEERRTDFARPGSRLVKPVAESVGARLVDAAGGVYELPLGPYVGNSMGALQGGVAALLVDLAAEAAARAASGEPLVTRDLALNYLALGRRGPVRSDARVLRRDAGGILLRVALRDAAGDLLAVASARAAESAA